MRERGREQIRVTVGAAGDVRHPSVLESQMHDAPASQEVPRGVDGEKHHGKAAAQVGRSHEGRGDPTRLSSCACTGGSLVLADPKVGAICFVSAQA